MEVKIETVLVCRADGSQELVEREIPVEQEA